MTGPEQIRIAPASTARELRRFIRLPYRIYRGNENWVAPLLRDMRTMFDPGKHPFHLHSEVQPFLAYRGTRPVGRIAAIHNRNHVAFHGEAVGFFGFFECEDNRPAAAALFEAAGGWLRERGLEALRGPTSFSTNEQAGLLVEGFDHPPVIMMPYNPPYYADLILAAGLRPEKELLAYYLGNNVPPEHLLKREQRLSQRLGVRLRSLRMDRFEDELGHVRAIYNEAWERNWGFVPMTDEELRFMARELKPVVARNPELVTIVENDAGIPIGFSVSLLDYNRALIHARGRLFPLGLPKILWYSRKIPCLRVLTLGVVPEYRGKGLDSLMYLRIFRKGAAAGVTEGEFSWVLEDNTSMRVPLEKMGCEVYKRYRIYHRSL